MRRATLLASLLLSTLAATASAQTAETPPKPMAPVPHPVSPMPGFVPPQVLVTLSATPGAKTCDQLVVNGKRSDLPGLDQAAKTVLAHSPHASGIVKVDSVCAPADVAKIVDALHQAGIAEVKVNQAGAALPPPTDAVKSAATGTNAFAVQLYGQLKGKGEDNLFFSPLSVAAALALVDLGSAGETAKQLDAALHLTMPHDQAHLALSDLLQRYVQGRGDSTLEIANRLWVKPGLKILPEYTSKLQSEFAGGMETVDFSKSAAARKTINDWVSDQTHGKISELIGGGAISGATELVLTNAVYFLGTWQHPFDPAQTADAPFTLASNQKANVPMMHLVQKGIGVDAGDVQVVELPYGQQGSLAFDLIVPKAANGLPALEKKLQPGYLDGLLGGLRAAHVTLAMPKFTQRSQFELTGPLTALGLGGLFKNPDFSAMTPAKGLFVSAVIHQAFVDVNEKGTEAAAATAVITSRAMLRIPELNVTADHPFLFVIRDTATGGILFMGRVSDPRK